MTASTVDELETAVRNAERVPGLEAEIQQAKDRLVKYICL